MLHARALPERIWFRVLLEKIEMGKKGGWQLTGKTVGIVGCGNVGSDIIQLLAPLQCDLLVCDIVDKSKFCQAHNATQTSTRKT